MPILFLNKNFLNWILLKNKESTKSIVTLVCSSANARLNIILKCSPTDFQYALLDSWLAKSRLLLNTSSEKPHSCQNIRQTSKIINWWLTLHQTVSFFSKTVLGLKGHKCSKICQKLQKKVVKFFFAKRSEKICK